MLYFTNFRQILEGERRFNRHVIPLNHLLFSHVFVKHLNTVLCKTFFLSAVKKHLYCGKIKLIAFLIGVFPGGKGGLCVRLTTLPPCCAVVMKSGNLNFLESSGFTPGLWRDCFTFYLYSVVFMSIQCCVYVNTVLCLCQYIVVFMSVHCCVYISTLLCLCQ